MIFQKKGHLLTGAKIEHHACQWLIQQGLYLVTQNYRCKGGEIDIIMSCNAQLVFVEVRYRRCSRFGSALESVDRRKQKKLLHAATHFLTCNPHYAGHACRFDVIAAQPPIKESNTLHWTWVKNAFTG